MRCGPIDPDYPTRFYLPCSKTAGKGAEKMTGIRYDLPADLICEHCVAQWYYVAANDCNLPGLMEYFTGPHAPKWGNCKGQGGAVGGFRPYKKYCGVWNGDESGKYKFAEEYYSCSDITIKPGAGPRDDDDGPDEKVPVITPVPLPSIAPTSTPSPSAFPEVGKEETGRTPPVAGAIPSTFAAPSLAPASTPAPSTSPIPSTSPTEEEYKELDQKKKQLLPEPTDEAPIPSPTPATSASLVAYVEIKIGENLFKIRNGESRSFRTNGAAVSLNAVTFGEKPVKVVFKVQSYGWRTERVHPYTFRFPQRRSGYPEKPMNIRVNDYTSDGKINITQFFLQLY